MIDLHSVATPNGHKVSIMLEETGLPYEVIPYNIFAGDQFTPEFLKLNPNNQLPVIVDIPNARVEPVATEAAVPGAVAIGIVTGPGEAVVSGPGRMVPIHGLVGGAIRTEHEYLGTTLRCLDCLGSRGNDLRRAISIEIGRCEAPDFWWVSSCGRVGRPSLFDLQLRADPFQCDYFVAPTHHDFGDPVEIEIHYDVR